MQFIKYNFGREQMLPMMEIGLIGIAVVFVLASLITVVHSGLLIVE